jgi:isoquinoline 1-oxidoreductase alpha subunit
MELVVNGRRRTVDVDPQKPLLWVLREDLGLSGTKYGCGVGVCGCCAILLAGTATRSCLQPVGSVGDREVVTIEGLGDPLGRALKESWLEERVAQCGYCQPGQIVAAYDLLSRIPHPTDRDVEDRIQNLCRCGTYQRVRAAITRASRATDGGGASGAGGSSE